MHISEENLVELVREYPKGITYVEDAPDKLWLEILSTPHNGRLIKYKSNPSDYMIYRAVKNDGKAIAYVDNPSKDLRKLAISNGLSYVIGYIDSPTEEEQMLAVALDSHAYQYIENPAKSVTEFYHRLK